MLKSYRGHATVHEFHIARKARDRYAFDQTLYASTGNVIFANFHAARVFAQRMNDKRDLVHFPEKTVRAAQLNAMGLIDEILHFVAGQYRETRNPEAAAHALAWLEEKLGCAAVDAALRKFCDDFPPVAVYRRAMSVEDYLAGESDGIPNRQVALEELMMLWLENVNPAFGPFGELFDDDDLERETAYGKVITELHAYFQTQPCFGPDDQQLIDMLRAPAVAAPHSLTGQLEYILTRWASLLGKYLYRLLSSLDFIKEEEKAIFFGRGPSLVPTFGEGYDEPERFSADKDWMPRTVMLAKNAYVWLDQLSRQYERPITRLDQIPDEELDTLARRGFTGLWLIGLWERSIASRTIKQMCGNPDAVASAYSLLEYEISDDLGDWDAMNNLRERAWRRGIRMASDMVPNHMGIDSNWVIEHPDWFIGLDYSPFPSYSFNGHNFSRDDRVGLQIEDHYYSRDDAAVVFKRVDQYTGGTKYIYHGNDGTNMPWNDTAQLNFLNPEVREAVIQTILHVARNFPIIRFDAAMTLAKKHFQRLWFPEPGNGGAIPSRAEHGLTRQQFNDAIPVEFWREVVDRVAQEVPDTLLLAEAFWLMEGYFVRTLGMHRVYNSAFMNMLRDEENTKYRWVMKNTLEFDPEVLKRYVNFMNNPDEHTAVEQFGSGDKYFGICVLMCTLPGLPMFGHGQIEGYAEKYGMEYRRAYWDEKPNEGLVAHHERAIFPLLHYRHVFAEVRDFLLYDFWATDGFVNDNVYAYSNRCGDERGLVVYHNCFADARGWVRTSVGYAVKGADGVKQIVQRTLGEGLGLRAEENYYTIFRDAISGLEYIRPSKDLCEHGLYVELHAYQYQVFLDFREVVDNEWRHYANLHAYLNGRPVPSIESALLEVLLQPVHRPFGEMANAGYFTWLFEHRMVETDEQPDDAVLSEAEAKAHTLLTAIRDFTGGAGDPAAVAGEVRARCANMLRLPVLLDGEAGAFISGSLLDDQARWGTLFGWLCAHELGKMVADEGFAEESRSWLDEWQLGRLLAGALRAFGLDDAAADYAVLTIKVLTAHQQWFTAGDGNLLDALFSDYDAQRLLQVNRHQGILWYNREAFESLLWWLFVALVITEDSPEARARGYATLTTLRRASEASGYQVDRLLEGVGAPEMV